MKNILFKILKGLAWICAGIAGFVLLYLLLAFMFSRIIFNAHAKPGNIKVFVMTNGVHTDIALPVHSAQIDWSGFMPFRNITGNDTTANWLALGWGDKGFYLETPTWADLKFSTAFNAVFGLGGSAIHATYYSKLKEDEHCRVLYIDSSAYRKIIGHVFQSLKLDNSGKPIWIRTNANYGRTDAFYEAKGRYSMFSTCNTWTNNVLKEAGLKACAWTPFESGVMRLYE